MISYVTNPTNKDSNRVNIFYFSDYHGNVPAYRHLKAASDEFDRKHKDTENLKLSGGDITAGNDPKKNILIYRLLNQMKMDASAVGNHEWDNHVNFYKDFNNLFNKAPRLLFNNYISCNTDAPENNTYKEKGLFQSKIITKNNEKYGIIGATTYDDYQFDHCKMHGLEQTKKDIANEVQNLKKKDPSLNKFILVSHLGIDADKNIAKTVSDIDIIIGGHSHNIVEGVVPEKNLFMSPKNEPVLMVQAGNEKAFGELSVAFDKDGKIDLSNGNGPINTVKYHKNYSENIDVKDLEDRILGTGVPLGNLTKTIRPDNPLIEENPLGILNADALKKITKSDVALINAGSFRSFINEGPITARNIEYCIPFSNDVVTIKCTGKDIADVIKLGVESTRAEHVNPGLYQVAGIKYTVAPDKSLKSLYTVDEKGNKQSELVDSQGNLVLENSSKKFTVALTDFMIVQIAKRGALKDFVIKENNKLKVDEKLVIKRYDKQREMLIKYLKTDFWGKNRPIDIETGRITFEKPEKPLETNFLSLVNRFTQKN